jgi:hypothetical protein
MKDRVDTAPIACSLTTVELRDREAMLFARFRSAVIETQDLQEGYAFRLPGDGEWIKIIAELIVAERECCPFLAFEVAALPNMGPLIVRVIGPAGAKEFLRTLLYAHSLQFPGSPTVRINCSDAELNSRQSFGLTCRLYADGTGLPPEEALHRAISAAAAAKEKL